MLSFNDALYNSLRSGRDVLILGLHLADYKRPLYPANKTLRRAKSGDLEHVRLMLGRLSIQ